LPNDIVKPVAPEYYNIGNIQITHLLSASHSPYDSKVDVVMKTCKESGDSPYWIPSGASLHPLGGLGYARFAFEIASQERELNIYFDTIIVPCASGSTLAGMIAGFKLLGQSDNIGRKARKIIGIDAFANAPGNSESQVLDIAKKTGALIGLSESIQVRKVLQVRNVPRLLDHFYTHLRTVLKSN